jgi:PKD repeat protein
MKKLLSIVFALGYLTSFSQDWVAKMLDTNSNFYDIKASFDAYWKDHAYERGHGYNAFKRWEHFVEPRVYPTGNMRLASRSHGWEEYQKWVKENAGTGKNQSNAAITATTANWTPLGPFGSPANGDAGRVQTIRCAPGASNTIFVGTAAGGLWVSTNGGTSYTTATDMFPSLGISDIAISPTSTLVIYVATGDKDAGDTESTGVMKSTDGGQTFNTTGLTWATSLQRKIYRVLIDPTNANNMVVASSVGMYKSIDAGVTWTLTQGGDFMDAEYRPANPGTVYAVTANQIWRSTDGGTTYSNMATVSAIRLSLAVTAANSNYVYVLASKSDNGFGGLHRSTNTATSFSLMSTTPNIFDWSSNGANAGGQGWYDIAIDASPTNANEIVCGGVNSWRSTNGGSTWSLLTHWTGSGAPYVHADLHHVYYYNGNTIFMGTDGGIARTSNGGSTWTTINGNMNIAQIYKIGLSASSASRIISGHQDNGTNLLNGTAWSEVKGGDGFDCFIDWNNNNTMVGAYTYGAFARSTNGGGSWSNIVNGLTGTAAWVAPIVQDPLTNTTYYCGYSNMFKSTNQGTTWTQMGTTNMGVLDEIYVCPNNSQIIYCTTATSIWKTTNGGTTWSNVTSGVPTASAQITDITCDNQNPNNVYVTLSGYVAGTKVYASTNGGVSWSNYSTGLPNIPHNCIIYRNNTPQVLYVGTDMGVYYRELSMSSWIPYMQGLPNVVVDELEIYSPTQKLRAATYGRGVWETNLYSNPSAPPFAYFSNQYSAACVNVPFVFNDASANTPTSWSWSFPGGSPASSSIQNPTVTYAAAGVYTVTLTSTNGNGPSSPYTQTIVVNNTPTFSVIHPSVCANTNTNIPVTTNGSNVSWSTGYNGTTLNLPSAATSSVYSYTISLGACTVASTASLTVYPTPPIPTISINGMSLTTNSSNSYQWYLNGTPIPGATTQDYLPTSDGWYSVDVTNSFGCVNSATAVYITVTDLKSNSRLLAGISVNPNPAKEYLKISAENKTPLSYEIVSVVGQRLMSGTLKFESQQLETILNIQNLTPGTYFIRLSDNKNSVAVKFIKE